MAARGARREGSIEEIVRLRLGFMVLFGWQENFRGFSFSRENLRGLCQNLMEMEGVCEL